MAFISPCGRRREIAPCSASTFKVVVLCSDGRKVQGGNVFGRKRVEAMPGQIQFEAPVCRSRLTIVGISQGLCSVKLSEAWL